MTLQWPWSRRLVPIPVDDAGDDATAVTAMLLHYYRRDVSIADIRTAFDARRSPEGVITFRDIADILNEYRLHARGVEIAPGVDLMALRAPLIAHMSRDPMPFPTPLAQRTEQYFAVVEQIDPLWVSFVDPYEGRTDHRWEKFLAHTTGMLLLVDEGAPIPTARMR